STNNKLYSPSANLRFPPPSELGGGKRRPFIIERVSDLVVGSSNLPISSFLGALCGKMLETKG
ncbi:MAG: hypothetical protein U9N00_04165, partial [Candidatus Bipolaricaulota bacterium]|nr:hypothetical protein [Candidatus Bipolaricaulota bacterium]